MLLAAANERSAPTSVTAGLLHHPVKSRELVAETVVPRHSATPSLQNPPANPLRARKMPSTLFATPAYAAQLLLLLSLSTDGVQAQKSIDDMTYVGCFSSSSPLKDQGPYRYQTSGYCRPLCEDDNAKVFGLSEGSNCWCGDLLPAASSKVSDSNCDVGCDGYDKENCGGNGYFSVYTVQQGAKIPNYSGSGSSNSGSSGNSSPSPSSTNGGNTNTAEPSVVTSVAPGQTVVVTMPAGEAATSTANAANQSPSSEDSGPNVAAIAAGVVVGVVALCAIAGAIFFFVRRKKKQAAEEEYKRNNQVGDFMRTGGKPPATGYSQMSDSRLDPEAGARRNSNGSIADDQDYSRRVLRVANPDNS